MSFAEEVLDGLVTPDPVEDPQAVGEHADAGADGRGYRLVRFQQDVIDAEPLQRVVQREARNTAAGNNDLKMSVGVIFV